MTDKRFVVYAFHFCGNCDENETMKNAINGCKENVMLEKNETLERRKIVMLESEK